MSPRIIRALPIFLLVLTGFPSSTLAEQPLVTNLQAVLDEFHAANPSAPGIVVRVACPSLGLEWTAAVGTARRGTNDPLTPGHTFRIAGNTKTCTAAADCSAT
jgi:CubicO group peptidase (beta-lactamase class C family)